MQTVELLPTNKTVSNNNEFETVEYRVVHRNNRRLRVEVPLLAEDLEYASRLQQFIESLSIVTSVRINSKARSIAVEYDAKGIDNSRVEETILNCIGRRVK